MSFFSSIIALLNGSEVYTNSEVIDGELRETFAADVHDHNVCIVRYGGNNDDVGMWVDRSYKHGSLDDVDSFVKSRTTEE